MAESVSGDFLLPRFTGSDLTFSFEPSLDLHEQRDALERARRSGLTDVAVHAKVLAEVVALHTADRLTPGIVRANWRGLLEPALRKVSGVVGRAGAAPKNREQVLERADTLAGAALAVGQHLPDGLIDTILDQGSEAGPSNEDTRADSRTIYREDLVDTAERLLECVELLRDRVLQSTQEMATGASGLFELLHGGEPTGLPLPDRLDTGRYRPRARWRLETTATYRRALQQHLPGRMSFAAADQRARASQYDSEIGAVLSAIAANRPTNKQVLGRAQHAVVERTRPLGLTVARVLAVGRKLPEEHLPRLRTLTDEVITATAAEAIEGALGQRPPIPVEDLPELIKERVKDTAYEHADELGITPPRTWRQQPGKAGSRGGRSTTSKRRRRPGGG